MQSVLSPAPKVKQFVLLVGILLIQHFKTALRLTIAANEIIWSRFHLVTLYPSLIQISVSLPIQTRQSPSRVVNHFLSRYYTDRNLISIQFGTPREAEDASRRDFKSRSGVCCTDQQEAHNRHHHCNNVTNLLNNDSKVTALSSASSGISSVTGTRPANLSPPLYARIAGTPATSISASS